MERVEQYMDSFVGDAKDDRVSNLYKTQAAGKRVRAKLALIIGDGKDESAKLAAIIESVHFASLLHDDVIDESDTRRGEPSVNALEGSKVAVMVGDIFYSKAFFELVGLGKEVAQSVSEAVFKLSRGELQDVFLGREFNQDASKYEEMIYLKTASLIEATCQASALLVGKDSSKYAQYGKNLGLAFQIIDDILDITQPSEVLGKPAFHDFKEGKTTLPYIYLYESLDSEGKEYLKSLFGKNLSEEEKIWIKSNMESSGALAKTLLKARTLAEEASKLVSNEDKLIEIIDKVINRNF